MSELNLKPSVDLELRKAVKEIVNTSSKWERYGIDAVQFALAFPLLGLGLLLLRSETLVWPAIGVVLCSISYVTLGFRGSHIAAHGALCADPFVNKVFSIIFSDCFNQFSYQAGYETHIKGHHPYTNVIGYGDSSTFKAPFLTRYVYLFGAPFLLPLLSPLASAGILVEKKLYKHLLYYSVLLPLSLYVEWLLLVKVSGLSISGAILVMYLKRALFSIPFLHVNVFQHIGLKFYEYENRPKSKTYQMSNSVLNLTGCGIVEWVFGASICSCHLEHHLFPKLSDHMLKKIRPTVKDILTKNGFLYMEYSYSNRLRLFIDKYNELMVKPPSLVSMVGIQ